MQIKHSLRYVSSHIVELGIGAALLYYDIRFFLFYWMVLYLYTSHWQMNFLRRVIRVLNVATEVKVNAIVKHLGLTDEDIRLAWNDAAQNSLVAGWQSLEEDAEGL